MDKRRNLQRIQIMWEERIKVETFGFQWQNKLWKGWMCVYATILDDISVWTEHIDGISDLHSSLKGRKSTLIHYISILYSIELFKIVIIHTNIQLL